VSESCRSYSRGKMMNWISLIYWVTFSILGIITGHQILLRQEIYRTVSKKTLGILRIFFIPTYIFLVWIMKASLLQLLISQILLISSEFCYIIYLAYHRKVKFQKLLVPFLDDIVINLSIGKSLRDSILMLKDVPEYRNHIDFREIIERFQYQSQNEVSTYLQPEAVKILNELEKILIAKVNMSSRLRALRYRVKSEQTTLERVKLATSTAKAQTIVCTILYLGFIIYTANSRSSFFTSVWFLASLVLFFLGLVVIQRLSQLALRIKI